MSQRKRITVQTFYETGRDFLELELLQGHRHMRRVIGELTISRPGLALAGFLKYFPWRRIQVLGMAETQYLKHLPPADRRRRYEALLRMHIPCIVLTRNLRPDPELLEIAAQARVPVFRTPKVTMHFVNDATLLLEELFAPEEIIMGSMVDILGIGVIIRGSPGIGKSECVLALIERGYSLVSDDVVRVRLSEERKIIGTSPETTREFMEVRGIGVINVPDLFGVRSFRTRKQVDLVVTLEHWKQVGDIERVGLDQQFYEILGIRLPHMVIPVAPGRDTARLVEVAAFYIKHRMVGGNPAEELQKRMFAKMNLKPKDS